MPKGSQKAATSRDLVVRADGSKGPSVTLPPPKKGKAKGERKVKHHVPFKKVNPHPDDFSRDPSKRGRRGRAGGRGRGRGRAKVAPPPKNETRMTPYGAMRPTSNVTQSLVDRAVQSRK